MTEPRRAYTTDDKELSRKERFAASNLRSLFGLLRPYRGRWMLSTVLLLAGAGVNLALPQALRVAIDDALSTGDRAALGRITLMALGGFVVLGVLTGLRNYLMTWLGSRVVSDLRVRTFRHLLRHPPGYFHERESGALLSRLTSDIGALQHAVGAEFSIALRSAITVLGGVAVLTWTSPKLTSVMLALLPPLVVGAVWLGRRIRKRAREVQDAIADANAGLKEAVVGIDTVQTFNAEPWELGRYGQRIEDAFDAGISVAVLRAGVFGASQALIYSAVAAILWWGGGMVIDGGLTSGALASFLLYTLMVSGALVSLADIWANLQRALGASLRVFELVDEDPAIASPPEGHAPASVRGEVALDHVRFVYPSRPEVFALDDVSLTMQPGEVVALVGPSGAGKSTIASLLHRFHDPTEGQVLVDGVPLSDWDLDALRRAIATVQQEPVLFSGTIAENIRYGRPDATEAEVIEAAREACVADFVDRLPEGYDSRVGERGVKLSGGERQRIAIARALLADPRILILDEATSHLDAENEALVQLALSRLLQGRSTLVIAHRLSTVRDADRIVVLQEGRVLEQGTHASLMEEGSLYPRLVARQRLEPLEVSDDDGATTTGDQHVAA